MYHHLFSCMAERIAGVHFPFFSFSYGSFFFPTGPVAFLGSSLQRSAIGYIWSQLNLVLICTDLLKGSRTCTATSNVSFVMPSCRSFSYSAAAFRTRREIADAVIECWDRVIHVGKVLLGYVYMQRPASYVGAVVGSWRLQDSSR
jgi:hypothetical protein